MGAQEQEYVFPESHHSTIYLSMERPLNAWAVSLRSAGRFPGRGRSIPPRGGGLGWIPAAPPRRRYRRKKPAGRVTGGPLILIRSLGVRERAIGAGLQSHHELRRTDLLLYVGVVFGLSSGLLPICIEQEIR
jgi:hypothetical protein